MKKIIYYIFLLLFSNGLLYADNINELLSLKKTAKTYLDNYNYSLAEKTYFNYQKQAIIDNNLFLDASIGYLKCLILQNKNKQAEEHLALFRKSKFYAKDNLYLFYDKLIQAKILINKREYLEANNLILTQKEYILKQNIPLLTNDYYNTLIAANINFHTHAKLTDAQINNLLAPLNKAKVKLSNLNQLFVLLVQKKQQELMNFISKDNQLLFIYYIVKKQYLKAQEIHTKHNLNFFYTQELFYGYQDLLAFYKTEKDFKKRKQIIGFLISFVYEKNQRSFLVKSMFFLALEQKDFVQAKKVLEEIELDKTALYSLYFELAKEYRKEKQISQALDTLHFILDKYTAKDNDFFYKIWQEKALCNIALKNLNDAANAFIQSASFTAVPSAKTQAFYEAANLYFELKNYPKAIEYYTLVLLYKDHPFLRRSLYNKAFSLFSNKQYNLASEQFAKFIAKYKENTSQVYDACYYYALSLQLQQKPSQKAWDNYLSKDVPSKRSAKALQDCFLRYKDINYLNQLIIKEYKEIAKEEYLQGLYQRAMHLWQHDANKAKNDFKTYLEDSNKLITNENAMIIIYLLHDASKENIINYSLLLQQENIQEQFIFLGLEQILLSKYAKEIEVEEAMIKLLKYLAFNKKNKVLYQGFLQQSLHLDLKNKFTKSLVDKLAKLPNKQDILYYYYFALKEQITLTKEGQEKLFKQIKMHKFNDINFSYKKLYLLGNLSLDEGQKKEFYLEGFYFFYAKDDQLLYNQLIRNFAKNLLKYLNKDEDKKLITKIQERVKGLPVL